MASTRPWYILVLLWANGGTMFRPPSLRGRSHSRPLPKWSIRGIIILFGQHRHIVNARIHHGRKGKVYHAVAAAEGHACHGAAVHQLGDEVVIGIRENDAQRVFVHHNFSPSCTSFFQHGLGPHAGVFPNGAALATTATPHLALSSTVSGRAPTRALFFITAFSAMME